VLAVNFPGPKYRRFRPATNAIALPQAKPGAMGLLLIVPSIRSREVVGVQRSGIRQSENPLQQFDLVNDPLGFHSNQCISKVCSCDRFGAMDFEGLDVSLRRTAKDLFRILLHHEIAPGTIQFRKAERFHRGNDSAHTCHMERNEIWVAVHEADISPIGTDLRLIPSEQGSFATFRFARMKQLKTRKMPADADQRQAAV
jgi:hypothetical protein